MLGSVTEKVLRKARCPVLTVNRAAEERPATDPVHYSRILCPVDFSETSLSALGHALSVAQEAAAELILLHVLEPFVEVHKGHEQIDMEPLRKLLAEEARVRLRHAVPDDARNWCRAEEVVRFGKPYREIIALADERRAVLIVIGAQGRNVLDHMLFGLTTQHVVRAASCPVLTVPRGRAVPLTELTEAVVVASKGV